jgi:hypothetical protein
MRPTSRTRVPVLLATAALLVAPLLVAPAQAAPDSVVAARPRGTKVVGSFSATRVAAGTPVTVAGKVRDRGRKRRVVVLEQKVAGGWRTVERTRSTRRGAYAMAVPTHWFYSSRMRVRVTRTRRSPGDVSGAKRVAVVPGYVPTGSSSDWAWSDRPRIVANPCRTITYGINTSRALPDPATATATIQQAVALLEQATGMRFRYVGETSAMPFDRRHRKRDPRLVFGWTSDAETPLDLGPAVAARGGADKARWARDARGRRVGEAVSMGVIYDTADLYTMQTGLLHLTMHELGHAVGLGHVGVPDQHMTTSPTGYDLPLAYGAGDLAGLARAGLQSGCLRPFRAGHRRIGVPVPTVLD